MPKKQESSDDSLLPEALGKGYAYVQHGIDRVIHWGLRRMEAAGEQKETKKAEEQSKAVRMGKGALRFFGRMGNSYFQTYEELKRREKKG